MEPFLEPLSERLKDMLEIERQATHVKTATDPEFEFYFSPLDRDMLRFEASRVLEAQLTHAWHELTWRCCSTRPGALVIDVGGNYGWYSLFSAALGCSVVTFEPVAEYRAIISAGLARNPGFAQRVKLYPHLVTDSPTPRNFTLRVPVPVPGSRFKRMLGMAGMVDGAYGLVKGVADNYINVSARSMRIDDLAELGELRPDGRRADVCMLKADVEGYEPQVFSSASALLRSGRVHAVQIELTKPSSERSKLGRVQREETIQMLRELSRNGFELKQVANDVVDSNSTLPRVGRAWRESQGPWDQLPSFPSARVYEHTRQRMASNKRAVRRRASRDSSMVLHAAMPMAYTRDVTTQSTNLIGRLRSLGG